jgi:hypothetical protein
MTELLTSLVWADRLELDVIKIGCDPVPWWHLFGHLLLLTWSHALPRCESRLER